MKLKTKNRLTKQIWLTLMLILTLMANPLNSMTEVEALQPIKQANTGTQQSNHSWASMGRSFILGDTQSYVTSLSQDDGGFMNNSDGASATYSDAIDTTKVDTLAGGEMQIKGSHPVRLYGGGAGYFNFRFRLIPANFVQGSYVKGRSLLDNLYLEGSTNSDTIDSRLANGTHGWINPIISAKRNDQSHSKLSTGRLWSQGSSNYSAPARTYTTSAGVLASAGWSNNTAEYFKSSFDMKVSLPKIDQFPPTISFSPNSNTTWTSSDRSVTVTASDAGTGVKRLRTKVETTIGSETTTSAWSGYTNGSSKTLNLNWDGRLRILVEAEDNNGNVSTKWSGYFYIDKKAPSFGAHKVSNERYKNGNDYWYRPGDTWIAAITSYENNSRHKATYIRIHASDNDNRAVYYFTNVHTTMNQFSSATYTQISSGRAINRGYTLNYEWTGKVKTNSSGKTFNVQYYFIDNANNSVGYNNTGSRIRVDGVAPVITANPASRAWGSSDVSVALTFSDALSGVNQKQYKWSTSTTTPTTWDNYSSSVTQSGNGTWYLHARSTDNVGNVKTERFGPYRIDKTAPNGSFSPNATSGWVNTNQSIHVSGTDATSGYKQLRTRIETNGGWGSWSEWIAGQKTIQLNSTGKYRIQAEIEDNAGNRKTITSGYYQIDKWSSTVNGATVYDARYTTGSDHWFRPSDKFRVDISGTESTSGMRYSYLRLYNDASDNRARYDWGNDVLTEVQAGTHTSINKGSKVQSGPTYVYRFNAQASSGSKNQDLQVHSYFTDIAGNTTGYMNSGKRIRVDGTPPTVSANISSRVWGNTNAVVSLTYSDARSGIQTSQYKWSNSTATPTSWDNYTGSVTQSGNGTWYLHYRAVDRVGYVNTGRFGPFRVDKTLPNGTISGNSTTWTNQNITLNFNATDTGGSGVKRVRRPNGAWVNGTTASQTVTSNGTYTFGVEDNAGNIRDVSVTVNRIDKTLPNGTITGNPTSWTNKDVTLNFNATDTGGSGVKRVRIPNGTWVNRATASQTITQNGTYTFRVEDNAGNIRDVSVVVNRIEKLPPNGTITGNPTSWTNKDVTLKLDATDTGGSGVKRVRRPNGTWVNGTTASQTVTSNGTYTFRVEDNAGNIRDVSVVVDRIDKLPPNGTITGNPTSWTNENPTLKLNATDTGGSNVRRIQLPNGNWVDGATASQTVASNGTYTFRVEDNAGNIRDVSVVVDRIDKLAPNGIITGNPTSWTNKDATLRINATDTGGSNVRRIQLPNGNWANGATASQVVKSNGTYSFRIEDNAGNYKVVSTTVKYIDKVSPSESVIKLRIQ